MKAVSDKTEIVKTTLLWHLWLEKPENLSISKVYVFTADFITNFKWCIIGYKY